MYCMTSNVTPSFVCSSLFRETIVNLCTFFSLHGFPVVLPFKEELKLDEGWGVLSHLDS